MTNRLSCLMLTTALAAVLPHLAAAQETPPAIEVLSGFDRFWTAGTSWDNGTPTADGEAVLRRNIQTVIGIARTRTEADEVLAFEYDAQNANYAVLGGLGALEDAFKAETGAFTTVIGIPDEAYTSRVRDGGNGMGDTTSGLGKVVDLVSAVRYPGSTTPAKSHYNYPRPFRQALDGQDLSWVLQDSLVARVPETGDGDGGFPSGHTNAGYLAAYGLAYALPQQLSDIMLRAGEIGYSRVVTGIHSPLDVIGGRMHATYYAIEALVDNPTLRAEAHAQAQAYYAELCGGSVAACYPTGETAEAAYAQYQTDKALYAKYTFADTFDPIGDTTLAAVVPENAEVLIETRYPYLTAAQLREVLATTSTASGGVLDNGMGYDRLNLFEAANGYGAFNGGVTVTMDAAQGGLSAADLWLNDIDGTGSLTKDGSGQLTLAGRNSWTGGTTVLDGTLAGTNGQAFGTGAIRNDATLAFDFVTDDAVANTITGTGAIRKDGAGMLDYTGDASGFTGTTTVAGGTLAVNGALGGAATVADGATIGGTGTVGALTVAGGGTLAPGNSVGTLTVAGDLVMEAGSTYAVEVDPATGASDRVAVGGSATLNGGSVLHVGQDGSYDLASSYTILTAEDGIAGAFGAVSSGYAFLNADLTYAADAVTMQLVRNDTSFASVAQTANQSATATAVETLGSGNDVYDALVLAAAVDAPQAAFDALSGEGHASLAGSVVTGALGVTDAITRHARAADAPAVWATAYGSRSDADAANGAAATDSNSHGILAGFDAEFAPGVTVGAFTGAGRSDLDVSARGFSAETDGYQLGAWVDYSANGFGLTAGIAGSWGEAETTRTVTLGTFANELEAERDTRSIQIFTEARQSFDLTAARIEPFVGLTHVSAKAGAFTETGGAAALSGEAVKMDTTFATLGLRAERAIGGVTLDGSIGWRHAFGDVDPAARLAFAGGDAFEIAGAPIAQNSARVEAGLSAALSERSDLSVSYSGQFGDGTTDHGASLKVDIRF